MTARLFVGEIEGRWNGHNAEAAWTFHHAVGKAGSDAKGVSADDAVKMEVVHRVVAPVKKAVRIACPSLTDGD